MFVADKGFGVYPPDQLKAAGYDGEIGYCSPDPRKNLTIAQINANIAAGLHQGIVYESFNQAASRGGPQGQQEAQDFLNQLRGLGATSGSVMMAGSDPNATGPQQSIRDYFNAAQGILVPAGFRLGDYGDEAQVNDVVAQVHGVTRKWFVGAWSQDTNADLIQQANHPGANTFGGAIDCNYAPAADWGWVEFGGIVVPPPPPPPAPVIPQGDTIAEDGVFGPQTIVELQEAVGCTADGVYGPDTRRHLQAHLGVAQDGVVGPQTVRALQTRVGATVDGQWGSGTTRALQHALNTHAF